jgi:hypothetical protein
MYYDDEDRCAMPPPMQWMILEGGMYKVCGPTVRTLPAGAYACTTDCYGNPLIQVRDLQVDDLIDVPESLPNRVLAEINRFWGLGETFNRYGFLHRRGYLFYGKQGMGKSALIHQVVARIVGEGHLAFFCENPAIFVNCLQKFRQVEPERPIVCVFEDIDAIIRLYGDSFLLQWLDGNYQVNKAVNLASTNYPENLDRRIVSRPRRFDRIHRIEGPDARVRAAFFSHKMPGESPGELSRWVQLSEGLSFASLAELVISVKCLGHDLPEAVSLLKDLEKRSPSSGEFADDEPEEDEE